MQFLSFAPIILDLILILIFILLRIYINCKHKTNLYQYSLEFIYKNEISRFGLSPSRTCNQWTNIIQTEGLNINFRDFQIRNWSSLMCMNELHFIPIIQIVTGLLSWSVFTQPVKKCLVFIKNIYLLCYIHCLYSLVVTTNCLWAGRHGFDLV